MIFQEASLNIDNFEIKYKIIGDLNVGIPIIFLHEGLGSIKQWKDFPEKIYNATGIPCILYDRRGYGESSPYKFEKDSDYLHKEVDMLQKLLNQLSLEEVVLFGHSDGATIALIAAGVLRDKIKCVIAEAPHVIIEDKSVEGIRETIKNYPQLLKPRLEKYHGIKTDTIFNSWANTWIDPNYKSWNCIEDLKKIKCPTLVVQGENDHFASVQQLIEIRKAVDNARTILISDVKHVPHFESEREIIKLTLRFIRSLDEERLE